VAAVFGFIEESAGFVPAAVAGFQVRAGILVRVGGKVAAPEFSCSFQEFPTISLWITGLSVGGL
jgi:hypothetical protein